MGSLTYYFEITDNAFDDPHKQKKIDTLHKLINDIAPEDIVGSPSHADILGLGHGDGGILEGMRKYKDFAGLFMPMDAGTLGFLGNHFKASAHIPDSLDEFEIFRIPIRKTTITTVSGEIVENFFISDLIIGGHVSDFYNFRITSDKYGTEFERIPSSGMVINSPLGSTGYAMSNGMPLMGMRSQLLGLSTIGGIGLDYESMPSDTTITITDVRGRDARDVAHDGKGHNNANIISNVQQLVIHPADTHLNVGYKKDEHFEDRRTLMSEKGHGNVMLGEQGGLNPFTQKKEPLL